MNGILAVDCQSSKFTSWLGDRIVNLAGKNEHLELALYISGGLEHNWRSLYMVLEAIEDGTGGEKGLIKKQWCNSGAIKKFKKTSNSFKALGLDARHGAAEKVDSSPELTLEEARELIRQLLSSWTKELENQHISKKLFQL